MSKSYPTKSDIFNMHSVIDYRRLFEIEANSNVTNNRSNSSKPKTLVKENKNGFTTRKKYWGD